MLDEGCGEYWGAVDLCVLLCSFHTMIAITISMLASQTGEMGNILSNLGLK